MPQAVVSIRRAAICKHVHVSGRRCKQVVNKYRDDIRYCTLHTGDCAECQSLMQGMVPRKGYW